MPTYTCWTDAGTVDDSAKAEIAAAVTEIHHEVGRAPRYFVQVVFNELAPGSIFVAGRPAVPGHVWIRADIRAGRTDEQKRELLARLTTGIGAILGTPPEEVWVYICDIPGPNIAEYGRPLPDPGEEDAWFAALPAALQADLEPLK